MSNHEYWNELGNLYFLNEAYEPAIHAYLRAIELDGRFGRSYANLAMAYVKVGKYTEAIKLYRQSIALLPDENEKAIARTRLGILYRQIMENEHPLETSQPSGHAYSPQEIEDMEFPLTVSMPDFNIDFVISDLDMGEVIEDDEMLDINAKFEIAEEEVKIQWFENEFVPPDPEPHFQTTESLHETISSIQSEWRLAYTDDMTSTELATQIEDEFKIDDDVLEKFELIVPVDLEIIASSELETDSLPTELANLPESVDFLEGDDEPAEEISYENSSIAEVVDTVTLSGAEAETAEYSQVEYPLMELSDSERNSLEMDIAKYKYASQNNPRNYSIWEMLGDAYKALGKYKDAILAFQTAISINSTKPSFYYRLGLIYAIEGREEEAMAAFQRVLELDPNYAQAHASLASHYLRMGLDELAQSHIDKALNTNFEEETEYNRACLEAICGHNDRALELLEVALQAKQTYINWAQVDPDLDSLRKDHRFHHLLSAYASNG
ncbi:MAG: tetratricopeptide repeat protein [Anaerolineales bacterium]|nr:tetratricopeptide repeat protein [Anaerolineales bacterium]